MKTKTPTITLVPYGGLGNRMKAIASGIELARRCGSSLEVYWFCDKELGSRFDQLFEPLRVEGVSITMVEADPKQHRWIARPRKRTLYLGKIYQLLRYLHRRNDPKTTIDLWNLRLAKRYRVQGQNGVDYVSWARGRHVWIASCIYFMSADTPDSAYDVFTPLPHIRERIDSLSAGWSGRMVGVHVRRTDNAGAVLRSRTEYFIECMRLMPQDTTFYVASDDDSVKQQMAASFPGRVTTLQTTARRDTQKGMEDAVVEMYLLARTCRILGSHQSTFSDAPASIGRISLTRVDAASVAAFTPPVACHPRVLAIVVSFNFLPWMKRCLGSLLASAYPIDIMVIDNCSTDDTVATLRRDYPQVHLVANDDNLRFARGNNVGMHYALEHGYDGVLLLNQDAWIDPDTLGQLAEMSCRCPRFGIISPVHLTAGRDRMESGFASYSGLSDLSRQPDVPLVEVPFIDAAIWYVPTEALRKVGLFDNLFEHYGEDKDLTNRMRYYGYHTGYMPHVYGVHDREGRKVTRRAQRRADKVYLLSEYANVNYTRWRSFKLGVLAYGKKLIACLIHLRIWSVVCYLGQLSWMFFYKSWGVRKARRRSRNVNIDNYGPK